MKNFIFMLVLVSNWGSLAAEVKSQSENLYLRRIKMNPPSQQRITTPSKRPVTRKSATGNARTGSPNAAPNIAPLLKVPSPTIALTDCGSTLTNSTTNIAPLCVSQQPVLSPQPTGERVVEKPSFIFTGPLIGYPSTSQQTVLQVVPTGERVIETPSFIFTGPLIGYPSTSQQPAPQVGPSSSP